MELSEGPKNGIEKFFYWTFVALSLGVLIFGSYMLVKGKDGTTALERNIRNECAAYPLSLYQQCVQRELDLYKWNN